MKNINLWKPTKFIFKKNRLIANRNEKYVNITSRILADKIAVFYEYAIKKYAKGKLLDLGCGSSPLYIIYKDYCDDITCVDWKNSKHQTSYIDIEQNLNDPLLLKDNQYDTIILSDVLEHIRHPENLCREIHRILKPNGILLMNVPFYYNLHEKPFDYYRYTEFALNDIFKENGFDIINIDTLGGIPEILTDLTTKTLKKVPYFSKFLIKPILLLNTIFSKTKFYKKFSKNSSKTFPFGYSLIATKK